MPRKSARRAASKEAIKQMQLLSNSAYDDDEYDSGSPKNFETQSDLDTYVPSDEEMETDEAPPKKKYRMETDEGPPKKKYRLSSSRRTDDGNDHEVFVLKSVNVEELLTLDAWIEDLSEVQKAARAKLEQEYRDLNMKIEQVTKSAEVIFQGEAHSAFELENSIPPLVYMSDLGKTPANAVKGKSGPKSNILLQATNTNSSPTNSYQLVMDPRLGVIVGTMTPTTPASPVLSTQHSQSPSPRQTRLRGKGAAQAPALAMRSTPPVKTPPIQSASSHARLPAETASKGPQNKGKTSNTVVDLTSDDGSNRGGADSKEISFNKLQGKTFPSLVVVARPHLSVKDISGGDRTKLDAKVKSVLMYVPTKFTEWLIQQGLVRSEQVCVNHPSTKLKLGMYSDVSKFPYSGGYVWISECCPTRFVSVFSGSLFEGSSHPPSVILKLVYHWACQTNVQNVVQWVKVDNLYVKGINTFLRSICTAALHSHVEPLGGLGKRVEVGVISLGTTTQDGAQRQVKVEVLGVLESEPKHVRLRAIEPLVEADRNYKKRFAKILEPLHEWVQKDSIIVTDLTVDKQTLLSMGYTNVQQSTSGDAQTGNQTIMEYLRRIVPRMFQNTLSLLSRQIIQQFLDELVWREWYGTTAAQCFDNALLHIAEQTRTDLGESLIMRLNKVSANPFRNWSYKLAETVKPTNNKAYQQGNDGLSTDASLKKGPNRQKKSISITADSSSPDRAMRSISPDVPEQLVPLENYYYGTIDLQDTTPKVKYTWSMKCSMCKSVFNNNLKLMCHLFTHAHNVTGNVFQCQYCLSSVGSQEGLTKHIATSHPTETKFMDGFVCIICEQRFANTFSLGKHLSKEHVPAELPYQCGTCTFRCSSHRQSIEHFHNKHDSGTTIQCPFCLKSTTIVSSGRILSQNMNFFLQHLQKHQKKALARKCAKCALWFINKDTLKEHQTNMHVSQRRKNSLFPWPSPRNGTMVPKSKTDIQVWEDSQREVDVSNITINAPNKLLCKECKTPIKTPKHYQSMEGCQNQNCQYETCCKTAMDNHTKICSNLNTSLPIYILPKEMFCICGYSDIDGNLLAKHLAQCERKSAYPSAEIAKKAIKTHSMLDVLGLVRRPEEPSKSTSPVFDILENDEDETADAQNSAKKTAKRKRKIDEIVEAADKCRRGPGRISLRGAKSNSQENEVESDGESKTMETDTDALSMGESLENAEDNRVTNEKESIETEATVVSFTDVPDSQVSQNSDQSTKDPDVIVLDDVTENEPLNLDFSQDDIEMDADVTVIENTVSKHTEAQEPTKTATDISDEVDVKIIEANQTPTTDRERDSQTDEMQTQNEVDYKDQTQDAKSSEEKQLNTMEVDQADEMQGDIEESKDVLTFQKELDDKNDDDKCRLVKHERSEDQSPAIEENNESELSKHTESSKQIELHTNTYDRDEELDISNACSKLVEIEQESIQVEEPDEETKSNLQLDTDVEIVELTKKTNKIDDAVEETLVPSTGAEQIIQELMKSEAQSKELIENVDTLDEESADSEVAQTGIISPEIIVGELCRTEQEIKRIICQKTQSPVMEQHDSQLAQENILRNSTEEKEIISLNQNTENIHELKDLHSEQEQETIKLHQEHIEPDDEQIEPEHELMGAEHERTVSEPEEMESDPEHERIETGHMNIESEHKMSKLGLEPVQLDEQDIDEIMDHHEFQHEIEEDSRNDTEIEEVQQSSEDSHPEQELEQEREANSRQVLDDSQLDLEGEDVEQISDDSQEVEEVQQVSDDSDEEREIEVQQVSDEEQEIEDIEQVSDESQQEQEIEEVQQVSDDSQQEAEMEEVQNISDDSQQLEEVEDDSQHEQEAEEIHQVSDDSQQETEQEEENTQSREVHSDIEEESALKNPHEQEFVELQEEDQGNEKFKKLPRNTEEVDEQIEETEAIEKEAEETDEHEVEVDDTDPLQQDDSIMSEEDALDSQEDSQSAQEPILPADLIPENIEDEDQTMSNDLLDESNSEVVNNSESDDDVEENIENIQKELLSYRSKQVDLIDKDTMDVDLPDIFEELGQNNTVESPVIDNSGFDTEMTVENSCFDNAVALEPSEDNTKMLEEFIESIQTDTI